MTERPEEPLEISDGRLPEQLIPGVLAAFGHAVRAQSQVTALRGVLLLLLMGVTLSRRVDWRVPSDSSGRELL